MPSGLDVSVKTLDKSADVLKGIAALAENRVYAGVPSAKGPRSDQSGEPVNNAALMYIHENGAPEINLPARPVVHPAIKEAQGDIISGLRAAGIEALSGKPENVGKRLNVVGMIAQNAMRKRITDGPFVPLSPKTIAQRARKRGTKRRKGEQQYLDLVAGGVAPAEAQAAAGIKPLIDTAQLRGALTYVLRKVQWIGKKVTF